MTNQLTPVQTTVLAYVQACPVCANMIALKYDLEHMSRYTGYTVERAALELVEQGVLVQEGNLLMVPEASEM